MSLLVPLVNVYIIEQTDDPAFHAFDEDLNGSPKKHACDASNNSCFSIERCVNNSQRISIPNLVKTSNVIVMGARMRQDSERIAGMLCVESPTAASNWCRDSDLRGGILIHTLCCAVACRRRGVSSALLDAAERCATTAAYLNVRKPKSSFPVGDDALQRLETRYETLLRMYRRRGYLVEDDESDMFTLMRMCWL